MIANGSNEIIYCHIGDLEGPSNSYRYETTKYNDKISYTAIQPNSHFSFTAISEYQTMTIISKSNVQICVNLSIMAGKSYIVSEDNFLKNSVEGEMWKDTDGVDHKTAASHASIKNDDGSFNPLNLFPKSRKLDTDAKKGDDVTGLNPVYPTGTIYYRF